MPTPPSPAARPGHGGAFLEHLRQTLEETEKGYGVKVKDHAVVRSGSLSGEQNPRQGDQFGSVTVELTPSEERDIRTETFIKDWQARVRVPAGIENFVMVTRRQGPPGNDLVIRLAGQDAHTIKQAALEIQASLRQIPGVYGIEDDMPYGREQVVFNLTPAGEAMGLSLEDLSRQLRAGLDGKLVQLFQDGPEEVEVRVRLPESERASLALLERMTIRSPNGDWVPLTTVARWTTRQGFEALRHAESQLAVEVNATVNSAVANTNEILAGLTDVTMPELTRKYGIHWSFEGRAADQRETMAEMKVGVMLGLSLIYIVLAWVFGHYGWPLIIMLAIPFGLVGAITGHWIMGIDLTILSMFGLFGLSGIVVNDSIVLVEFYRHQREQGHAGEGGRDQRRLPAPARHPADLADHHRRLVHVDGRDLVAGPVPHSHGHFHHLRPGLHHRPGPALAARHAVILRIGACAADAAAGAAGGGLRFFTLPAGRVGEGRTSAGSLLHAWDTLPLPTSPTRGGGVCPTFAERPNHAHPFRPLLRNPVPAPA
jgi:hypothetical protein